MIKKTASPLWIYPEKNEKWKKEIVQEFSIHPITAQVLISRGFTNLEDIHQFLYGKLPSLHSPFLFPEMEKAVRRIFLALQKKERILVYGDNDVDGMTGAALLTELLENLQADVLYYLSNREDIKNHMIENAVTFAEKNHCSLLITVDCGITAHKEIRTAFEKQIDVIITDHHEPVSTIPECVATLNPKLIGNNYPNKELTGVGVAFKLAHALLDTLIKEDRIGKNQIDLKDFLDLVAMGTISDMGALVDENRILVRYGLKAFETSKRVGLVKLLESCDVSPAKITTNEIASKIAPRLNSLGRIADPNKGVELLLCKEERKAQSLAQELNLHNIERQTIERKAALDIEKLLRKNPHLLKEKALILYSDKWHPGIIPILAAKLSKQYNRPTIIIAVENGVGKGSARTITEFPLLPMLKKQKELLLNFGGHNFAAGLTIKKEDIAAFRKGFLHSANESLKERDLLVKLYLDAEANFEDLTFDFMESLQLLEPFGNENPPPILYAEAEQTWAPKVIGDHHLKMFLEQKDRGLEAIGFNLSARKGQLKKKKTRLKLAFTPYVNVFRNKQSIQLQIKDFKVLKEKIPEEALKTSPEKSKT